MQRGRSSSSLVSDTRSICSVQDSETEVMEVHISSSDFLHFSRRSDTLQEVRWFWVLEAVVADTTQLSDTRFTAVTGLCTDIYEWMPSDCNSREEFELQMIYQLQNIRCLREIFMPDTILL
jgi:hypothetical protein